MIDAKKCDLTQELRLRCSQTLGGSAIGITHLENGTKNEMLDTRTAVDDSRELIFRLVITGKTFHFEWGYAKDGVGKDKVDEASMQRIGPDFDTTKFSDEYCKYGEFTGTFVGLTCADRVLHRHCADFDFFDYDTDETKPVA